MVVKSGYTLPVFACASAIAALKCLQEIQDISSVEIDLIKPAEIVVIPIEQVAKIGKNRALAIAKSDPGDHLDLTRNTPIWVQVELRELTDLTEEKIIIQGGEGIGINEKTGTSAIYQYAQNLLKTNLLKLLKNHEQIIVTIILPEGRKLAERTSNAAFGIVEGLSLLGTTGIVQPLTAPGQLELYQLELKQKASKFDSLVFCVGENGLSLATKMGIDPDKLVKTANWMGDLLVIAALEKVQNIVLFGYHGKLIKLAGGIFHTHHHLADGRREIITAHCANLGLSTSDLQQIFKAETTDQALNYLREIDQQRRTDWEHRVYEAIAAEIDDKSATYIYNHSQQRITVGSILFDRDRKIIIKSENASRLMTKVML
jgi:cobalt-precorrin-5B (C1)-methyltransferase